MLTVSMSANAKSGGRKVSAFLRRGPGDIKKGLRVAGAVVLKQWRKNISGDGYTRNPSRSVPFPGVASGQMFRTLALQSTDGGMAVRIGPDVDYAIYHETGTRNMPARPVVEPTWDMAGEEALAKFHAISMGSLRS